MSMERKLFMYLRQVWCIKVVDPQGNPLQVHRVGRGTTFGFVIEMPLTWWQRMWYHLAGFSTKWIVTLFLVENPYTIQMVFSHKDESLWDLYGRIYEFLAKEYPHKPVEPLPEWLWQKRKAPQLSHRTSTVTP